MQPPPNPCWPRPPPQNNPQVSFEIDGDLWKTAQFIDNVRLPYIAPSLGGVESLIEQPTVIRWGCLGAWRVVRAASWGRGTPGC